MMFKKREFTDDVNNTTNLPREEEGSMEASANTDELIRQWHRDAEQLMLIVPEFSLDEAVKNKSFSDELRRGATVFEAYKKMLEVPKQQQPKREEILQNARSARRGTGGASVNPAKLSSDEFKKYIDQIKNG